MDPQVQAAEHGANAAKRSKSKAVAVNESEAERSSQKCCQGCAMSSQALDVATASTAVLQGQDQKLS